MSEAVQSETVGEEIDLTEELLNEYVPQGRKFKQLKEGWMLGQIVNATTRISGNGNREITLRIVPVEGDTVAREGSAQLRVYPPKLVRLASGAIEAKPNTVFSCGFLVRALDAKFPRYPHKVGPGAFEDSNGAVLNEAQRTAAVAELDRMVISAANGWYRNTGALLGQRILFKNIHEQGKDGRMYDTVKATSSQLPDGETLISSDFYVTDEA